LASILGVPSGFTGGLRESGFATRPRSSRDRASPDVFDETKISRDSNPVQAPLDEGLVRAWEAHCSRGGKLFANHDLDAARLEYESALEIARSVLHSHPQFGSTYQELGVILQAQGDHESAAKLYEEALELFREVHGVGATQTTNLRKSLVSAIREEAWSLHESGQKRAAEWRYRRAIEFADEIDSPNIWLGVCLKELAFILKSLGRHAEAEPLYDRVLPIFEEFYGEADPEVKSARRGLVAVMREIAWEHYRSNNEERAEHKYRETLVIARSLGASDIWLGHTLNELAIVLNSRGAHQEAESHYTSALEIFEGEYGLLHRNVVSILNRLVALQIANGQACRAQAIGERVLAAEESDPTACVRSLLTIGETLLDGKQADLAEWMFARVDERLPPEPLLDPEWR